MHYLRQKSQHLRLLFIEQYMNSNRVYPKRVKKKKKKNKNAKRILGSKQTINKIFVRVQQFGYTYNGFYFILFLVITSKNAMDTFFSQ